MTSEFWHDLPYDNSAEGIFAWHCHKHLHSDTTFDKQVDINTQHGLFRIDFVLSNMNEKIAVECNESDSHTLRDEFFDAILLGEGHFDTVYHFRERDITHYPDDCIWLVSTLNPKLFSRRGHIHLNRLHKIDTNKPDYMVDSESFTYIVSPSDPKFEFLAYRRTIHTNHRPYWKALYDFTCEHPGTSLDELMSIEIANIRSSGGKHR